MNNEHIPKFLIDTDVIVKYLVLKESDKTTSLIDLMQKGICFTSVLNASELFFIVKSDYQKEKVRDVLNSLKVLGLHARYSLSIPDCMNRFDNIRDALFYILAEQNKLTIISLTPNKYSGLKVKSIHPQSVI